MVAAHPTVSTERCGQDKTAPPATTFLPGAPPNSAMSTQHSWPFTNTGGSVQYRSLSERALFQLYAAHQTHQRPLSSVASNSRDKTTPTLRDQQQQQSSRLSKRRQSSAPLTRSTRNPPRVASSHVTCMPTKQGSNNIPCYYDWLENDSGSRNLRDLLTTVAEMQTIRSDRFLRFGDQVMADPPNFGLGYNDRVGGEWAFHSDNERVLEPQATIEGDGLFDELFLEENLVDQKLSNDQSLVPDAEFENLFEDNSWLFEKQIDHLKTVTTVWPPENSLRHGSLVQMACFQDSTSSHIQSLLLEEMSPSRMDSHQDSSLCHKSPKKRRGTTLLSLGSMTPPRNLHSPPFTGSRLNDPSLHAPCEGLGCFSSPVSSLRALQVTEPLPNIFSSPSSFVGNEDKNEWMQDDQSIARRLFGSSPTNSENPNFGHDVEDWDLFHVTPLSHETDGFDLSGSTSKTRKRSAYYHEYRNEEKYDAGSPLEECFGLKRTREDESLTHSKRIRIDLE